MTPSDRMFAAARDTADAVARRRDEADTDWTDFVDKALALMGDHSMLHAEHTGRAMRRIERDATHLNRLVEMPDQPDYGDLEFSDE